MDQQWPPLAGAGFCGQQDPERIALNGWSLGGHLAVRGASGEHRLAACVADPGLWSVAAGFRAAASGNGVPSKQTVRLGEMDESWMERLQAAMDADPRLRWSVRQRGFWVHGVDCLRDYLASVEKYTLDDRVEDIRCATLITVAENDSLGRSASDI